jgi:hypothetical protein
MNSALTPGTRFGGFFEVEVGRPGVEKAAADEATADSLWRPLAELLTDGEQARRKVLRSRELMVTRLSVPPPEDRVLASINFLGLAARLIAPWFGTALLTGQVPAVSVPDLWWQSFDGGAMPLLVAPDYPAKPPGNAQSNATINAQSSTHGRTTAELAGLAGLAEALDEGPGRLLIEPLLSLYRDCFALSETVLWGNVASGVAGAARAIALAEPPLADQAAALADALLRRGQLAGTAELPPLSQLRPAGWQIRRRSCCLFYRVPGAGTCADCVLNPPLI